MATILAKGCHNDYKLRKFSFHIDFCKILKILRPPQFRLSHTAGCDSFPASILVTLDNYIFRTFQKLQRYFAAHLIGEAARFTNDCLIVCGETCSRFAKLPFLRGKAILIVSISSRPLALVAFLFYDLPCFSILVMDLLKSNEPAFSEEQLNDLCIKMEDFKVGKLIFNNSGSLSPF